MNGKTGKINTLEESIDQYHHKSAQKSNDNAREKQV